MLFLRAKVEPAALPFRLILVEDDKVQFWYVCNICVHNGNLGSCNVRAKSKRFHAAKSRSRGGGRFRK